jgi:hypothetical protein
MRDLGWTSLTLTPHLVNLQPTITPLAVQVANQEYVQSTHRPYSGALYA